MTIHWRTSSATRLKHPLKRYLTSLTSCILVSCVVLALAATYYHTSEEAKESSVNHAGQPTKATHNERTCKQTYGIFPCSPTLFGATFLTLVYGGILCFAAQYIGDGGEAFLDLEVFSPSIIGGIVLPVLGAVPDAAIIFVSGMGGTKLEVERKIAIGVGTLAGSTIMLLTTLLGGCLFVGRCDINMKGEAVDQTLNGKRWHKNQPLGFEEMCSHAYTTGISHSGDVLRIKWFMLGTSLLYLCAQVPEWIFNDPEITRRSCFVGAIVCTVFLFIYLIDGAMQDQGEESEIGGMEKVRFKTQMKQNAIVSQFEKFRKVQVNEAVKLGSLTDEAARPLLISANDQITRAVSSRRQTAVADLIDPFTGAVNPKVVEQMFTAFDTDGNDFLDEIETEKFLKVVFMSSGETDVPAAVFEALTEHQHPMPTEGGDCYGSCTSKSAEKGIKVIWRKDFLDFVCELVMTQANANAQDEEVEAEENEDEDDDDDTEDVTLLGATAQILLGGILVALFSNCLVDCIDIIGIETGIPNFVIGFVLCPLVSNASEAISSLRFASHKKKRNSSVTFAQIYAACTMNNTMGLATFFGIVWYRDLHWNYGAEVISITAVTWLVGLVTCRQTTIRLWVGWFAVALYPICLATVEVMHRYGVA